MYYIHIYICIYNHIITHKYTSQIAAVVPTWAWDGLGGSGGPSSPLWYPCTLACSSQLLGFSCSNSNRIQRNLFGLRHWDVWGSCGCSLCHGEVTWDECVVWSSINEILAMVYRFWICVDWWPSPENPSTMAHLGFAKERIFTKHSLKRSCHQSCASFSSNLLGSSPTSGRIWQNQSLGTAAKQPKYIDVCSSTVPLPTAYQPKTCETKFTLCPKKWQLSTICILVYRFAVHRWHDTGFLNCTWQSHRAVFRTSQADPGAVCWEHTKSLDHLCPTGMGFANHMNSSSWPGHSQLPLQTRNQ